MPDRRAAEIAAFLHATPAAGARRQPLAGDASARRYDRLTLGRQCFVLMDAPPDSGEDVRPFVKIARWLGAAGFSAPAIMAEDPARGLLLMEDLGDALFTEVVAADPAAEQILYAAATDLLAALHRAPPPPGLVAHDAARLADFAALAWPWYRLEVTGRAQADGDRFRTAFSQVLGAHAGPPEAVALRDFHAQNLIWLPQRAGHARVGLLDFQDALLAPAVYDLVSLLTDARRDVAPELADEMTARFSAATGRDPAATRAACAVVGLQRNLRILGVFARLSLHYGKPSYVDLIPRVWAHLQRDLAHPANAKVRTMIEAELPAPTDTHLQELKDRCGTIQMR